MLSDSYVPRTQWFSLVLYVTSHLLFLWVCERVCDDYEGMSGFPNRLSMLYLLGTFGMCCTTGSSLLSTKLLSMINHPHRRTVLTRNRLNKRRPHPALFRRDLLDGGRRSCIFCIFWRVHNGQRHAEK